MPGPVPAVCHSNTNIVIVTCFSMKHNTTYYRTYADHIMACKKVAFFVAKPPEAIG